MKKIMIICMLGLISSLSYAGSCPNSDIVSTAVAAGNFTTLVKALKAANLETTLKGQGPFTVFAPTDDAFAKIPAETLAALLADIPALTKVLTFHVAAGSYNSATLVSMGKVVTLQGQSIEISNKSTGIYLNNSKVISSDICTSNGFIHAIDTVLMPE